MAPSAPRIRSLTPCLLLIVVLGALAGPETIAILARWTPHLLIAFGTNVVVGFSATIVATLFGGALGVLQVTRRSWRMAAQGLRNLPWLATIFFAVYVLPFELRTPAGTLQLSPLTKTILGLGVPASGYFAEVVRGAIVSLPKSASESGAAIGLTPRQTFLHVVLPLTLWSLVPGWINLLCTVVLATSLGSIVGVDELFAALHDLITYERRTDLVFWSYAYASLMFFLALHPVASLATRLEHPRWSL